MKPGIAGLRHLEGTRKLTMMRVGEAIGALAQKCLGAGGIGCEAWEKEIDERVAPLYGL